MTINITQLPPAPSRNDDPSTFAAKADAMLASLATFINQLNLYAPEVYAAYVNGGFNVNNGQLNVSDSSTTYSFFVEQAGNGPIMRMNNTYTNDFTANTNSSLLYTVRTTPSANAFVLRGLDNQLLLDQNAKTLSAALSSGGSASNRNYVAVNGASGTVEAVSGMVADIRNIGNGVVTNAAGYMSYFDNAGAGSIANTYGFYANNTFPGTAGNYGFYSNLTSGTNNYAFYGAGSAQSYLGGALTVVGAVTMNNGLTVTGAVTATTNLTTSGPGGNFGYATGAGGTITQVTSRTTGISLAKPCGTITLFSTTTTAGQVTEFTFTNSRLAANDVVIFSQKSGAGTYIIQTRTVSAGSCVVSVYTPFAVGTAEAPSFNFVILKSVTA